MAAEGGGMRRVLTFRTGRYGELRLVRKYEGDNPGKPEALVGYPLGDACAELILL